MKSLTCFLLVFWFFAVSSVGVASTSIATMNLSWSVGASGITMFKLYYSDNIGMVNKQWHQECSAPTEESVGSGDYSMTCTNIPISTYPAYIQVVGLLVDQSELASNVQEIVSEPVYMPKIIDITVN